MSKNNNNNGNRPVVENTEVIQESVKVMNEVETPVVKEAPVAPEAPEVEQTPVEETPKEEVKQAMPTNLDFEIENVEINYKNDKLEIVKFNPIIVEDED